MNPRFHIAAAFVFATIALASGSYAQPGVFINDGTPMSHSVTSTAAGYNVDILVGPATLSTVITIRPSFSSGDVFINRVAIEVVGANSTVLLQFDRSASGAVIYGLRSVIPTGDGKLWIVNSSINKLSGGAGGNLGSPTDSGVITADAIAGLVVEGDSWSTIVCRGDHGQGNITGLQIHGDVHRNISVAGAIALPDGLQIGGNLGSPASPREISVGDEIRILEIQGDAYGNIAFANDRTLVRMHIGGDFVGSLEGGILGPIGPQSTRLEVGGEFDADINLEFAGAAASLQSPIILAGGVPAGRSIFAGNGSSGGGSLIVDGAFDGDFILEGDAKGSLEFKGDVGGNVIVLGTVENDIDIEGDLSGALYIGEDLLQPLAVGGELSGLLLVGRDLDAAGSITMDGPLSGQIIINEQNLTPPGVWGGPVTLPSTMPGGPITIGSGQGGLLESPFYGVPSADFGGGAVGLAPFSINPADTDGGNSCHDPDSVTLWHYGPVFADGSGPPIKVFALDGSVEVEVTTDFTISVDDDPFTLDRKVTITLPSGPNISFANNYPGLRIEPVRAPESGYSVLRCAWVEGNPPVYDWSFSQLHDCGCRVDLNDDGVVDADDFFLFLQLFADGDPIADFNGDTIIDADDFFEFLTLFAAGC